MAVAFRLEANLLRGLITDPYGLDLAGILASRFRRLHQISGGSDEAEDLPLPLETCDTGDDWHWLATSASLNLAKPDPAWRLQTRQVDASWASRAAQRPLPAFSAKSGPWRDVAQPVLVSIANTATWWGVGNPAQVYALVKGIRFIGKRRTTGEGRVRSWTITPIEGDPYRIGHLGETHELQRPVPLPCAERLGVPYDCGWYGIRPPTFSPNRMTELAVRPQDESFG